MKNFFNPLFRPVVNNMKSDTKIDTLCEKVTELFQELLAQYTNNKGKISAEAVGQALGEEEFKDKLTSVVKENMPKPKKATREKRLKDPDAPKRPKTTYLLFCGDKRDDVKRKNKEMKATEITKKLGEMWKALSEDKKAKYKKIYEEDKARYDEEMKDYKRPSDEDLEQLEINQKKSRKKGDGEKKERKKKDPDAPKKNRSAYTFFSVDKRAGVKEDNPEMTASEISKELGRMWKEDFAQEDDRAEWVEMAEKDKERYTTELEEYKERKGRKEDDADVEMKAEDEEVVSSPKKTKGKTKKTEVVIGKGKTVSKPKKSARLSSDEIDEVDDEVVDDDL